MVNTIGMLIFLNIPEHLAPGANKDQLWWLGRKGCSKDWTFYIPESLLYCTATSSQVFARMNAMVGTGVHACVERALTHFWSNVRESFVERRIADSENRRLRGGLHLMLPQHTVQAYSRVHSL